MTLQYEFIRNGHRQIREPASRERQQIKSAVADWLKARKLYMSGQHRLPYFELARIALKYTSELRLPITEQCVWIRRADDEL